MNERIGRKGYGGRLSQRRKNYLRKKKKEREKRRREAKRPARA